MRGFAWLEVWEFAEESGPEGFSQNLQILEVGGAGGFG